jgi:hypothetical protein
MTDVQIPQEALEAGWAAILDGVRRKYPGALVELVDREEPRQTLSPQARADLQAVLDRAARRVLRERLDAGEQITDVIVDFRE